MIVSDFCAVNHSLLTPWQKIEWHVYPVTFRFSVAGIRRLLSRSRISDDLQNPGSTFFNKRIRGAFTYFSDERGMWTSSADFANVLSVAMSPLCLTMPPSEGWRGNRWEKWWLAGSATFLVWLSPPSSPVYWRNGAEERRGGFFLIEGTERHATIRRLFLGRWIEEEMIVEAEQQLRSYLRARDYR